MLSRYTWLVLPAAVLKPFVCSFSPFNFSFLLSFFSLKLRVEGSPDAHFAPDGSAEAQSVREGWGEKLAGPHLSIGTRAELPARAAGGGQRLLAHVRSLIDLQCTCTDETQLSTDTISLFFSNGIFLPDSD